MADTDLNVVLTMKDQLSGPLSGIQNQLKGFGNIIKAAFTVAAVVEFSKKLFEIAASTAKAADELQRLAERSGISGEALLNLNAAAIRSDLSTQELSQSLKFLGKNMEEARSGSQEARDSFAAVGITLEDLQRKGVTTDQIFLRISNRFKQSEDGAGKTAVALRLFGRAGDQMVSMLNKGSDGLEELTARSRELGAVMTGDQLAKFASMEESFKDLKDAVSSLSIAFVQEFGPAVVQVINEIVLPAIRTLKESMEDLRSVFDFITFQVFKVQALQKQRMDELMPLRPEGTAAQRAFTTSPKSPISLSNDQSTLEAINNLQKENAKILNSMLPPMEQLNRKNAENLEILNKGLAVNKLTEAEFIKQRDIELKIYDFNVSKLEKAAAVLRIEEAMNNILKEELEKIRQQNEEREKQTTREKEILEHGSFGENWDLAADNMKKINFAGEAGAEIFARLANAGSDISDAINAIADGSMKAKEAFHAMALSIVRDLQRILIVKGFEALFSSFFGGASKTPVSPVTGAAAGAVWQGGFQKFAGGSPFVDRPTLGLIGEGRNAEAVVPLPDNRSIPVKFKGGTGGGGNTIHFNVSTDDADSFMRKKRQITQMLQEIVATNMPIRRQLKAL